METALNIKQMAVDLMFNSWLHIVFTILHAMQYNALQ